MIPHFYTIYYFFFKYVEMKGGAESCRIEKREQEVYAEIFFKLSIFKFKALIYSGGSVGSAVMENKFNGTL